MLRKGLGAYTKLQKGRKKGKVRRRGGKKVERRGRLRGGGGIRSSLLIVDLKVGKKGRKKGKVKRRGGKKVERRGRLRGGGGQIKFIDLRFERWQLVRFRKARGTQDGP